MFRRTHEQEVRRATIICLMDGEPFREYLRPKVEAGMTRAEIIAEMTVNGFYDEEVDGALIELGVFPENAA